MGEIIVVENELVSQKIDLAEVFCPNGLEPVIAAIEAKAREVEYDVTTAKGRAAIGSLGQKIASSKVLLDNAGKKYAEDLKNKIKPIDSERKRMRDRLDSLKVEVLSPRDEWEATERAKIEAEETARQLELDHAKALEMESLYAREREVARKEAEFAEAEADRRQKEEAARLEKEREERERRLAEEAAAKAKAEAEAEAAKQIEAARLATEKAEREAKEAAVRAEEEKRLAVEAAELRAKEEAERKERERIADEEAKKATAEAERMAAEKKAANARHRAKINAEALRFIKGIYGTTEEQAQGIIDAIASGAVPHVTINY